MIDKNERIGEEGSHGSYIKIVERGWHGGYLLCWRTNRRKREAAMAKLNQTKTEGDNPLKEERRKTICNNYL